MSELHEELAALRQTTYKALTEAVMLAENLLIARDQLAEEVDLERAAHAATKADLAACNERAVVEAKKLAFVEGELAACREEIAPLPEFWVKFAWRHSNGNDPTHLEAMKRLNASTFDHKQSWRTYSPAFFGVASPWQRQRSAELRTGDWKMEDNPDMAFWAALEGSRIRSALEKDANIGWILLDAEVAWTERSEFMLTHMREHFPSLKVYSGPMSWSGPVPDRFRRLDGCLTFANPGSPNGRYKSYMGEDFALQLARNLGAIELFVHRNRNFDISLFPQPVEGSPPYIPNIVDEYRRALEIACSVSPEWDNVGVGMWGARRLFEYILAEIPPEESTMAQNAALNILTLFQDACPIDVSARPKIYIPQQMHVDGRPDQRIDKALARIVWHGGGLPVVAFGEQAQSSGLWIIQRGRTSNFLRIVPPAEGRTEKLKQYGYLGEFAVFNDSGSPHRQGLDSHELRCAVRDAEIEMAAHVREWLEAE